MSRTVLFGLCFSLFFAFVFSPGLLGYTEQGTMAGESALILDLFPTASAYVFVSIAVEILQPTSHIVEQNSPTHFC